MTPAIEQLAAKGTIDLGDKTVAMISSDNAYSNTIALGMKEAFLKSGWTITLDELVPFGPVSDWRLILAKIRENPTDSALFLQYAPLVPEFVNLTGGKSTGVLYNAIGAPLFSENWPRAQEVDDIFKAFEGDAPSDGLYGMFLYEMATHYFLALEQVGDPTDHDAIGKALGSISRDMAQGRLEFNQETHVAIQSPDHVPVTFFQLQEGGKGVMILPEAYSTGTFIRPPWMKN